MRWLSDAGLHRGVELRGHARGVADREPRQQPAAGRGSPAATRRTLAQSRRPSRARRRRGGRRHDLVAREHEERRHRRPRRSRARTACTDAIVARSPTGGAVGEEQHRTRAPATRGPTRPRRARRPAVAGDADRHLERARAAPRLRRKLGGSRAAAATAADGDERGTTRHERDRGDRHACAQRETVATPTPRREHRRSATRGRAGIRHADDTAAAAQPASTAGHAAADRARAGLTRVTRSRRPSTSPRRCPDLEQVFDAAKRPFSSRQARCASPSPGRSAAGSRAPRRRRC